MEDYSVVCFQTSINFVTHVKDATEADQIRKGNIKKATDMIDTAFGGMGGALTIRDAKILLFPEFFVAGFPIKENAKEWMAKGCIELPSEETDKLAERAVQYSCYICANSYEVSTEWPDRYFNTTFIIDPRGKIVLKYRKINTFLSTSPHDILDEYLKKHGPKSLFPVVETPYGVIGCLTCYDVNFPEVSRCLAMNGAEILLHPTGEPVNLARQRECKKIRAYENTVYFASANHSLCDIRALTGRSLGASEVIDFRGNQVAVAYDNHDCIVSGRIDIESLRKARRREDNYSMIFLTEFRAEAYAPYYEEEFWPANSFAKKAMESLSEETKTRRDTQDKLIRSGLYKS